MGFPRGHNARSRSIQIEKARGRSPRTPPGYPLSPPASRRYLLVTPVRIFKLQPFRHVKGDFCRTPSIGFNGHRYSNLFDGGYSSFDPSLPSLRPPFCFTLSSSFSLILSLSFSSTSALSPRQKPLHVTGASYPGVGSGSGEKRICISLLFFFFLSTVDTRADLERKPRRQMRASTRGNCTSLSSSSSSSIFRAAFPSSGGTDLEERLVSRYNVLRGE